MIERAKHPGRDGGACLGKALSHDAATGTCQALTSSCLALNVFQGLEACASSCVEPGAGVGAADAGEVSSDAG